jgi:hypothetical protein
MWAKNMHLTKDKQFTDLDKFLVFVKLMKLSLPSPAGWAPGRHVYMCPHYTHFYWAYMEVWEFRE